MGKITLLTGLIIGFLAGNALGQPTKTELTDYLKTTYQEQLNITALPGSFFDCGFRVFNYNYTKSENEPQKDIGDECLYPLLEDDLDSVGFSDRGRKLYQAMKQQYIQSCVSLTESTLEQCTCAHNYYDSKGLGYVDIAHADFPNSDIKKEAEEKCIVDRAPSNSQKPQSNDSALIMAEKWVNEYLEKNKTNRDTIDKDLEPIDPVEFATYVAKKSRGEFDPPKSKEDPSLGSIGDSNWDNIMEGFQRGKQQFWTGLGFMLGTSLETMGAVDIGIRVRKGAQAISLYTYDPDQSKGQVVGGLVFYIFVLGSIIAAFIYGPKIMKESIIYITKRGYDTNQ